MGKKKKKESKPWCYYCDREFEDEKVLIQHQKAKHFKCHVCHKKLSTAGGLVVHVLQVHKENLNKVPNAKPGRESVELEIFGVEGIPPEAIAARNGEPDDERPAKAAKVEVPTPAFGAAAFGMTSQTLYSTGLPGMQPPGAPMYSRPGLPPSYPPPPPGHPYPPPGRPGMLPLPRPPPPRPLFPIQGNRPYFPGQPTGAYPGAPSRPLFPIVGVQGAPGSSADAPPRPMPPPGSQPPFPVRPPPQPLFPISTSGSGAVTSGPPGSTADASQHIRPPGEAAVPASASDAGGANQSRPVGNGDVAVHPPYTGAGFPRSNAVPGAGAVAPAAPKPQAGTEVYLVWDDEHVSMEERRFSMPKYRAQVEAMQVPYPGPPR